MTYTQDDIDQMQHVYREWDEYDCFEQLRILPLLNPWVIATKSGDIDAWDDDAWSLKKNDVDDIMGEVQVSINFQLPVNSHIEWEAIFIPSLEDDDYCLANIYSDDFEYCIEEKTNFLDPYLLIKPKHHRRNIPFREFMSKLDFLKTIPSDHWPADALGRGYLNQHYWTSLADRFIQAEKLSQSGEGRRMDILTHSECEFWSYSHQAWDPQGRIAALSKSLRKFEQESLKAVLDLNETSAA